MSVMSLDLRPSGRIAGGGTVLKIAGNDDWLWLASPAGIFHFDGSEWRAVMRGFRLGCRAAGRPCALGRGRPGVEPLLG